MPQPNAMLRPVIALGLALLVAAALLSPIIDGAFLLDDLPNLGGLERVHAEPGGAARFVSTGVAGPGGRPASLATFALQAGDWPMHPAPFKRFNLALHLACGLALFWLWSSLARRVMAPERAGWLAFAVTALWLVHPLQLSSVAYVVQRMTLLAALPMLLGLVAFVKGRERVDRSPDDARGYLIALGGLGIGGLAAISAKESGALILPLALVIDHLLFPTPAPRWRRLRHALLHAPLALVALGLVTLGAGWLADGYVAREFTLIERLMSQPRALIDYVARSAWPSRDGLGVFHDDFATSTGLLTPWTTLPAIALLGAAVGAAVRLRRTAPLVAFSVAWFLGNHLLESTVMPLELYFEHRNYLALAGPLTLLALVVDKAMAFGDGGRRAALAAGVAYAALVGWQGHQEARDWGDPLGQARRWAAEHPSSLRAQSYLANLHKVRGELDAAAAVYLANDARFADGVSFTLDWLELGCEPGGHPIPSLELVLDRASRARFSYGPSAALDRMVGRFERGAGCPRVSIAGLAAVDNALLGNPAYQRDVHLLHLLAARIARLTGDRPAAVAAMRRAFDARPEAEYALVEAAWWLELADRDRAREALDRAVRAQGPNPLRRQALAPRIEALQHALAQGPIPKED